MNLFQRAIRKTKHIYHLIFPPDLKSKAEINYWINRSKTVKLSNQHYAHFYTDYFEITKEFYDNKHILDIGCGPCGSLEWADNSAERIGLDPLANTYMAELGVSTQKMQYIQGRSEAIPYPNGYFDVVCSFNSLDHVDNLEKTIEELNRVLKKGGLFLLITDVNHRPTVCEPISYGFDVIEKFAENFKVLSKKHFEKKANGIYESIYENMAYNHSDTTQRYGILTAKLQKK